MQPLQKTGVNNLLFWYLEDLTPRKTLVSKNIQYNLEELLQKRTPFVWTLPRRRP